MSNLTTAAEPVITLTGKVALITGAAGGQGRAHARLMARLGAQLVLTDLDGAGAEGITIEDDVWIGPNASVIQGLTLGRDSLLGIGAVAVKSVPENEVRVGNPAKRLGDNKK